MTTARKSTLGILAALLLTPSLLWARNHVSTDAVEIDNVDIISSDDNLFVNFTMDLSGYTAMESNREVIIKPIIVGEADSLALPAVAVAGRARYYHWLRRPAAQWPAAQLVRAANASVETYNTTVPYQPWMDTSRLAVQLVSRGCCGTLKAVNDIALAQIDLLSTEQLTLAPEFVFVRPEFETEKRREIHGSAYIDFPVNRTELFPLYRRNPQELAKINATIDSVRLDNDVTFQSMTIKGYASPEGPYDNNIRLAKGRTATLKDYVLKQYSFPESAISTSFEPEDWQGLLAYVQSSVLPGREGIIEIINSNLAPDPKNEEIRRRYPQDYAFLLREVYPGLRHSDYTVEYTVRHFTDIDEIKRLLFTAPQKLSLDEMFAAASTMEPGTPEYDEAYAVAVRMYPTSEVAALNAANAALRQNRLDDAAAYLSRSGNSPQAVYARGLLAALAADYPAARVLLTQAQAAGITQATDALMQLDAVEADAARRAKAAKRSNAAKPGPQPQNENQIQLEYIQ